MGILPAVCMGIAGLQAPWHDRQSFDDALWTLLKGHSELVVKQRLGPPDGVEQKDGETIWLYGSQGPGTCATLGRVAFKDGFVTNFWPVAASDIEREGHVVALLSGKRDEPPPEAPKNYGMAPSPSVITEDELRGGLRIVFQAGDDPDFDPKWFVPMANQLIPFGNEKTLAILREAARLRSSNPPGYDKPDRHLVWLLAALFDTEKALGLDRIAYEADVPRLVPYQPPGRDPMGPGPCIFIRRIRVSEFSYFYLLVKTASNFRTQPLKLPAKCPAPSSQVDPH